MVNRRTRRSKNPRSPNKDSPGDRTKKRNKDNNDKQEAISSVKKNLFKENTSSAAKESLDDDDDSGAYSSSVDMSHSTTDDDEKNSEDNNNNEDNNDNENTKKDNEPTPTAIITIDDATTQKIDLADIRPPDLWKQAIYPTTDNWESLDKDSIKNLKPFTTPELLGEDEDDKNSLRKQMEEGKEMIATDLKNQHPTIENWLLVILNVFSDFSPDLTHYAALRTTFIRLALSDPVALFPKDQWFNDGLSMVYESHAIWIASYIEFGAPWKNREYWQEPTKPPPTKPPPKPLPKPSNHNPYDKKNKKKPTKEGVKFADPTKKDPPNPPPLPITGNYQYLNKPLVTNPYKTKAVAKMKDYSRHYRTYVKIKLARITSESFPDQEVELTSSLKQLLHYIWATDSSALILPWAKTSSNLPLKKGSDLPKSKFDMDKYVDRIWMMKNQNAYCRMLVAHNPEPKKLFEDSQLQLCIEKSQLMLIIERIQADRLVSAGHLLGYHTMVCNCANLADTIQQYPILQGLSIEIRPEFISFGKKNGTKQAERSKTKILQVYVAWDSSGKARRALLQIYSKSNKGNYPLGVSARFVPNVEDHRFIHTTPGRLAYTNSLKKHIKFMEQTDVISTPNIIELDAIIPRYQTSLRNLIMHIFSSKNNNWNLFVAVDTSYYGDVLFAFRTELANEAKNMLAALPLFLEATLGHSDVWKWFTSQARDEAQDYRWDLQHGLVSKCGDIKDFQIDDWEHLDDLVEVVDSDDADALQPFKLDMTQFGSNTYRDDGTIQTHHLLAADRNQTPSDGHDADHDMTEFVAPVLDLGISSVTTTEIGTTVTPSTLTASPENTLLLEYRDHPLIMQALAAIQLNSQASATASHTTPSPAD